MPSTKVQIQTKQPPAYNQQGGLHASTEDLDQDGAVLAGYHANQIDTSAKLNIDSFKSKLLLFHIYLTIYLIFRMFSTKIVTYCTFDYK